MDDPRRGGGIPEVLEAAGGGALRVLDDSAVLEGGPEL